MPTALHPAVSAIQTHDLAGELRAILTGAAFTPLDDIGWLRITGPDATRWLNGMVTNAIQSLAPGEGCYNFLLNAQGRILGDCTIHRDPTPELTTFLLKTDDSQIEAIQSHLDRFIIMDDVELSPVTGDRAGLLLAGSQAVSLLQKLGFSVGQLETLRLQSMVQNGDPLDIIHAYSPLVPRIEFWSDSATISALTSALASTGAVPVSPATIEALRILSGIPRYGVDIRNTDRAHDLPQETGQSQALHFTKGCYLGQEIVERIHSRGSVHRTFSGFILIGALPPASTELTAESSPRPVGELTSVIAVPNLADADAPPLQLALGYIRHEALERNLPLHYPGGTATPAALPFALPFTLPSALP